LRTIQELQDLTGRVAVITGATGGLGRYMAETIAELGGELVVVDRPGSDYDFLSDKLNQINGKKAVSIDCDLEDPQSRSDLLEVMASRYSSLDILINNAAFGGTTDLKGWVTPFEEQSVDTWRRAVEVNLTAAFDLSKGLTQMLRNSGKASIINIASIYGTNGPDFSLYDDTAMGNPAAYAASKGGLIQLTRWLATAIAPDIRVNAISPGGVFRNQPEKFVDRYVARTPMGRMGIEEDFKGVIAYLASDMSAYVTGQNFMIDGGWTVW